MTIAGALSLSQNLSTTATSDAAHDLAADRALAAAILGGDESAFEALIGRLYPRVARIAGRFFRQPDAIEEIAQDVFVRAFVNMKGYRAEMPLEHWVSRIAVNACYDQLRRKQRKPETAISQVADDPAEFLGRIADPACDRHYWEREEARLCAEQLLAMLEPAERLVLTLMVLEELSVAEVARLTGWSSANVKVRAFRARSRLKKLVEKRHERRTR